MFNKKLLIAFAFIMVIAFLPAKAQENELGQYLVSSVKKTVSLDLEDAKLVDVLKMLSQQSGLNFVSSEAVVERKITLYLENAFLKEALDIIFMVNNLAYDYYPGANIFTVKEMGKPTIELQTKVYYLKYTRISSANIQQEIDAKLSSAGSSGSSSGSTGGGEGIIKSIEKVITAQGKVSGDAITNALIITDVPSQFPVLDRLVASLDKPSPRVMIEVEMLDVSKRLIDRMGVDYSTSAGGGLTFNFVPARAKTNFPFPHRLTKGTNAGSRIPAESHMGIIDASSFNMFLQMVNQDSTTKVLARPRILTLSNETAEVNLTINEAIGVTTEEGESGSLAQTIERMETGTKLRVTPQVNPHSGEITLFVEVFTKEARDSGLSVPGLSGGNIKNPEERGTKAVLRLLDGETLLIGGLIKENKEDSVTKIPFLGDIPILGNLFKYRVKDRQERELLVFLTPHLVGEKTVLAKKEEMFLREQADPTRNKAISSALNRHSK